MRVRSPVNGRCPLKVRSPLRKVSDRRAAGFRRAAGLCGMLAFLFLPFGGAGATGQPKEDYSKYPGYVDFRGLGMFAEEDAVVEVYLHDALLNMVAQMSSFADSELSSMLGKLKLIRVQKFRLDDEKLEKVDRKIDDLSAKLEKDGWMRAVRVREEEQNVNVYFKFGGEKVLGIMVMAVENGETAAFVNIVGEIDPAAIGRLGDRFNIDELHKIDAGGHKHGNTPKTPKPPKPPKAPKPPKPPEAPEPPPPPETPKPDKPEQR